MYDSSWDDGNDDAWDAKYDDWEDREWVSWLNKNLSFSFEVKRMEDFSDDHPDYDNNEPFTLDHVFRVDGIELEDESYGIIVKSKEGRRKGHAPLCDLEVTDKADSNYWPVREYVVWFANR